MLHFYRLELRWFVCWVLQSFRAVRLWANKPSWCNGVHGVVLRRLSCWYL